MSRVDRVEMAMKNDELVLGNKKFESRLLVGTGKYETLEEMQRCHDASGTQMVTIALRRVPLHLSGEAAASILDYIDQTKITLLPNTAGAQTGEEALRFGKIAKSMGLSYLKVEVMGEITTLLPDPVETLRAVELLRAEFPSPDDLFLMVYTNDDPVLAGKLLRAGGDAIMPAGSPIGSGRGIQNPANFKMIRDIIGDETPMVLDAGVGCVSDVTQAMEMGLDAVLLNTAIAQSENPLLMAEAMRGAWVAGRQSYLAGRIPKKLYATASSPEADF